ncbi:MAG: hypothetical protein AAGA01_15205 [Cyanobacteria bacterium P01_E01_bin.43]
MSRTALAIRRELQSRLERPPNYSPPMFGPVPHEPPTKSLALAPGLGTVGDFGQMLELQPTALAAAELQAEEQV